MIRPPSGSRSAATIAALCGLAVTAAAVAGTLALQTHRNLDAGMRDEAYVSLKYKAYARAARAGGNEELARLFEETAAVEEGHFMREADAFGLDAGAVANVAEAVAGEHLASTKMYSVYADQAEAAHDHEAAKLFKRLTLDEDDHYQAFITELAKITGHPHRNENEATHHD